MLIGACAFFSYRAGRKSGMADTMLYLSENKTARLIYEGNTIVDIQLATFEDDI